MQRLRDMRLKVSLAECPSCCFSLKLPILAISNEDPAPMKPVENIPGKLPPDVVLAVVLLDMFEVGWVIDNMETEERNCYLISRSISFIKRIPRFTTGFAMGLKFFGISSQWSTLWTGNPFRVFGGRRSKASVAVNPQDA